MHQVKRLLSAQQVKKEIHWCGLKSDGGTDSRSEKARRKRDKLREELEQRTGQMEGSKSARGARIPTSLHSANPQKACKRDKPVTSCSAARL